MDSTILTVTEEDIYKRLLHLKVNKSPGPDLIHSRVLFETSNVIASQLFLIFKRSLQTGIIPVDRKLAEVTAVHKKGPKSLT